MSFNHRYHLAALTSALVCIVVMVLYLRSNRHDDIVKWYLWSRSHYVLLSDHAIEYGNWKAPVSLAALLRWESRIHPDWQHLEDDDPNCLCIPAEGGPIPGWLIHQFHAPYISIPLWPFLIAGLFFPAIWLAGAVYRQVHPSTGIFCAQCGYDLRATPDRCPECGAKSRK